MIQQKQVESDRQLFRKLYTPFKVMQQAYPHFNFNNSEASFNNMFIKFQEIIFNQLNKLKQKIFDLEREILQLKINLLEKEERQERQKALWKSQKRKDLEHTTIPRSKEKDEDFYDDQYSYLKRQIQLLKQLLSRNHNCQILPCTLDQTNFSRQISPFELSPSRTRKYQREQQYLELKNKKYREALIYFLDELKEFKNQLMRAFPCQGCQLKQIVYNFLQDPELSEINLLSD